MPPKGKDAGKKGAVSGNFKAGKPLKDILPPNCKPPREGAVAKLEGETEISRSYDFEPLQMLPEWPGNDEAKTHDFKAGFEEDENGNWQKFTEPEPVEGVGEYHLPPSFDYFTKGEAQWLRPQEYIRDILYEKEVEKRRQEKKREHKLRKTTRKNSLMAQAQGLTQQQQELQQQQETELQLLNSTRATVQKDEIVPKVKVIASIERLETEAEITARKEAAEKAAAAEKGAKKGKAPAKGAPVTDPADDAQTVQIPIDGCLDMSFQMPKYTKWVTSQFQFIRDRSIRDVESNESIWQRIYPQQNGIPVESPTGKYWVKLRFMGKERLVEIDDRMPCSAKGQPILPRTTDCEEIWPQLLMKAILKVYSYKWFCANCQYDKEIGDGSIVYSLTGLIPETVPVESMEQAEQLFRKHLADDYYFGKKSFLTAYCENEFRPKFPSQKENLSDIINQGGGPGLNSAFGSAQKPMGSSRIAMSETESQVSSSSKMMLKKLKDAASLAISVTTGRKPAFGAKEKPLTNIIPGFGYALMDVFENEFVDMSTISQAHVPDTMKIVEENLSPFASPDKNRKNRDKSMGKDEYKRIRREERKFAQQDYDDREKNAPTQYSFIKIKTSIGKHPVINYLSTFTNDEIMEGKKHLINRWRRDPSKQVVQPWLAKSPSPKKGTASKFKIDINDASIDEPSMEASMKNKSFKQVDTSNAAVPKSRAAGGIWLTQSDFPHAFQNIIIYHNIKKYQHTEIHQDIWENASEPYISNEKEVYFKLELDEEAVEKVKQDEIAQKSIGIVGQNSTESLEAVDDASQSKEIVDAEGNVTERSMVKLPLPGEVEKPVRLHDNIIIACAPYPTNKAHSVLPRYLTRIEQVDCEIENPTDLIDQNYSSYFGGCQFKVVGEMSNQKCIWIKPQFNCPQGSTIWIASQIRKVSVVTKADYYQECKGYTAKQVTMDYLPQQAGKYQLFGKYELNVPEKETEEEEDFKIDIKVDMPNDKYLLDYMRLRIIDRSKTSEESKMTETGKVTTINKMALNDLTLKQNGGAGYYMAIEGVMPYNTGDGPLNIDTLCNKEAFELKDVVQCEPLEYEDQYVPTKYGIIFKEKIMISPTDTTNAAINIKLLKGGAEFQTIEDQKPRYFKVEILDNGKCIYAVNGYDQITISHFNINCNNGLPEALEEGMEPNTEIKHNYVIQALFDLHEWPECKTQNDSSADITWKVKVYSSETLALVKDTDKEDREKALKASWETEEPGRAELASLARQKFVLKKKLAAGEELTEEELAVVKGKRERVKKNAGEDAGAAKGKAPPKGGKDKGKPPAKGAPVAAAAEEVEEASVIFPKAEEHINTQIKEFLDHFASSRKIIQSAQEARKRPDEEKEKIQAEFESAMTAETDEFLGISEAREKLKEERPTEREQAFKDMDDFRNEYKEALQSLVSGERETYRGMIDSRKLKETELLDLVRSEKADCAALKAAITAAEEITVKAKYIKKGKRFLKFMEYIRDFEQNIQQAIADKDKEKLTSLLDRIDFESAQMGTNGPLPIDAKILNDGKGNLAKMK